MKNNSVNVKIENWPKTKYIKEYAPVVIAVFALFVSLYSIYLTTKSFIVTHRPFVWALSAVDDKKKSPLPHVVTFRVKNAPARIIRMEVTISLNAKTLFTYPEGNMIRFPDDKSDWYHSLGKEEFKKIMNRPNEDKAKLSRVVLLEYSSLDGGKTYHYKLQQLFRPDANQWQDVRADEN